MSDFDDGESNSFDDTDDDDDYETLNFSELSAISKDHKGERKELEIAEL